MTTQMQAISINLVFNTTFTYKQIYYMSSDYQKSSPPYTQK